MVRTVDILRRKRAGLTLIELVIVVALMAVIVTIVTPSVINIIS